MDSDNRNDRTVYVGNKPPSTYVSSLSMMAARYENLFVVARGKYISIAVDVVEMAIDRFLIEWKKVRIETGSEEFEREQKGDKPIRVSTIEIELTKNK